MNVTGVTLGLSSFSTLHSPWVNRMKMIWVPFVFLLGLDMLLVLFGTFVYYRSIVYCTKSHDERPVDHLDGFMSHGCKRTIDAATTNNFVFGLAVLLAPALTHTRLGFARRTVPLKAAFITILAYAFNNPSGFDWLQSDAVNAHLNRVAFYLLLVCIAMSFLNANLWGMERELLEAPTEHRRTVVLYAIGLLGVIGMLMVRVMTHGPGTESAMAR